MSFLTCRILTGCLEVALLVVLVDMMNLERYETVIKLCATVSVVALNYFASKRFIFKENDQGVD